MIDVVAIIVTYNPDPNRFRLVLSSAAEQANRVIIIDNASNNRDLIKSLIDSVDNCEFIEIGFNSGIAHALRVGTKYARKYEPSWLLFLDDDTILLNNALNRVLSIINDLPSAIRDRIGLMLLGTNNENCDIKEVKYGMFSGTLIRTEIALKTCCRDEFFLDQADFDMYSRIRSFGYLTLIIDCKLIDHRLGYRRWARILNKVITYEPPWRYYYIVRNLTKLLIEGKIDFAFYLKELVHWGAKITLADGPTMLIKPLGLGLIHALLGEFGYIDQRFF